MKMMGKTDEKRTILVKERVLCRLGQQTVEMVQYRLKRKGWPDLTFTKGELRRLLSMLFMHHQEFYTKLGIPYSLAKKLNFNPEGLDFEGGGFARFLGWVKKMLGKKEASNIDILEFCVDKAFNGDGLPLSKETINIWIAEVS